MEWNWKYLTVVVCLFGVFKDLRPSEAYLTAYLTGPWKNLTEDQVDNEIYPWWSYSTLIWLIPVFLITDYLRYKPTLVFVAVSYIVTWALLLWAQGVPAMKFMQVTFGLGTACEVSYYSYLYAVVSKDYFLKVTSFTRSASLIGKFTAYLLGQLLTSFTAVNYFHLNIFSFVSVCVAFLISLILPRAKYSELFNPRLDVEISVTSEMNNSATPDPQQNIETGNGIQAPGEANVNAKVTLKEMPKFLLNEVKSIYLDRTVLIWSVWSAFATCGNFQVGNYIQNLWHVLTPYQHDHDKRHLYNGAVESVGTLLSASTVLILGHLPINWTVIGRSETVMALVCLIDGVLLMIMASTSNIWVCYVLYDIFRTTYQIVLTISSAEIAKRLVKHRYGFVLGCNTFLALLIETVLTAIVVDKNGLDVNVQTQFMIYGGYFLVMSAVFTVVGILICCRLCCFGNRFYPEEYVNMEEDENDGQ